MRVQSKLPNKTHSEIIQFRIDGSSYKEIAKLAEEDKRTMAQYVRLMVLSKLAESKAQGKR
jgi:DNA-directed RNA polymerase specialized sigma24 family protein